MSKETEKIIKLMREDSFLSIDFEISREDKRMWVEVINEMDYNHHNSYFSEDLSKEETVEIICFRIKELEKNNELNSLKNILKELTLSS